MPVEVDKRNIIEEGEWQPDWSQAERDAELYGAGFIRVTCGKDGVVDERLDPKVIALNIEARGQAE